MLLAGPAVLAGAGAVWHAVYAANWRPDLAEAAASRIGIEALAMGQYQRASLALQSALRLREAEDQQTLYRLARCFAELGRRPEAAAMLGELAPLERPGYAPAHLFLAQAILQSGGVSPNALAGAETHLRNVLQLEPNNLDAQETLGRVYVQLGRWEQARRQLIEVVASRPDVALPLAMTSRELGDDPAARMWAERAARHFAARTEAAFQDDPRARMSWVGALVQLRDFEAAANALEGGIQKSGPAPYSTALAHVCAQWAEELGRDANSDPSVRIQALQRGLEAAAHDPGLLRELARLVSARGAEAEASRNAWTALLAEGRHVPLLHLLLGGLAHQRGDTAQADVHLRAAHLASTGIGAVANNLASTLIEGPAKEPELALALMAPLLARHPGNAYYRDTRGLILLQLGHTEAALEDLEFALPKLAAPAPTHAALAEAYQRLGRLELAAEHARQAEALRRARR